MSKCEHEDYDEYFEKCVDCGADQEKVIHDTLVSKLDGLVEECSELTGLSPSHARDRLIEAYVKWHNDGLGIWA